MKPKIGPETTLGELNQILKTWGPLHYIRPGALDFLGAMRQAVESAGLEWSEGPECRLELKLLGPSELCGACKRPAGAHRFYWHHTHP